MINEVLLVRNLLNGVGINKSCLYQHCYLLAKYYLQQGYEAIEVRRCIFDWACKYRIHLDATKLNVNRLIYKAESDKRRLREDVTVRISKKDINEITDRFDSLKTRKIALALLCYAKATADSDNCFDISVQSFCNWLHVDYSRMLRAYLKELQTFKYIERVSKTNSKKVYAWDGNAKSQSSNFKMLVSFNNSGEYILKNNDIESLFNECFP